MAIISKELSENLREAERRHNKKSNRRSQQVDEKPYVKDAAFVQYVNFYTARLGDWEGLNKLNL